MPYELPATNYAQAHLTRLETYASVTKNYSMLAQAHRSLTVLHLLNYGVMQSPSELSDMYRLVVDPRCMMPVLSYTSVMQRRFADNLACNASARYVLSGHGVYLCGVHVNHAH